jgi:hypothetical protein
MEYWNDGIIEWWSIETMKGDGLMKTPFRIPETHYSTIPVFLCSR